MSWPPERRAYSPVMTRRNRDAQPRARQRPIVQPLRQRKHATIALTGYWLIAIRFETGMKIIFLSNVLHFRRNEIIKFDIYYKQIVDIFFFLQSKIFSVGKIEFTKLLSKFNFMYHYMPLIRLYEYYVLKILILITYIRILALRLLYEYTL